ncbi:MAG: murein biosynthesis integral membrane protein MurJ [Candidatus Protochlamydia sp.]|nr:murein biosynthesis integral membrane protein MurJ [Candidatus Protochlamydia sp.]
MNDSTHTIRRSAKLFFSGTLLSRISGMLRDMAMAYAFGTNASVASFMVAYRLSHVCRRLFGEGALQAAFIPQFEALRHESSKRAFIFFRDLAATLACFLLTFILLGCLGVGYFLTSSEASPVNNEILFLTLLMFPSLLFICLFGLNASLLQCEKCFFTPAAAPMAFNFIWIGVVWLIRPFSAEKAMPLLAIGVIAACLLQWTMTVPKTWKVLKAGLEGSLWSDARLFSSDVMNMGKPFILGFIGVGASQINVVIDSLFARYAEVEGPALLWYAMRLQQLPLALFSIAMAGALLPPLTRAIKAHDWEKYTHFLNEAILQTLCLMIPLTMAIFAIGDTAVNLIFGHGDFSNLSVWGTARCLWAYGIGLIPTSLVLLLAPACYAQSHYRMPALAACLNMVLNFILNLVFITGFGWGAMSVALATSISAWANLILLGSFLARKNALKLSPALLQKTLKVSLSSCLAFLATEWWRELFYQPASSLLWNRSIIFPHSFLIQCENAISQFFLFVLIFFISCRLLKITIFSPSKIGGIL